MLYVAMTSAELGRCASPPPHIAWMSCQFSSAGSGLSNLPRALPKDSVIILSDQTPICNHDPQTVLKQLLSLAEQFTPAGFLLDFQRPGGQQMVQQLVKALPCPTAVSEAYAQGLDCPVFLSPKPLCRPLGAAVWPGRELWLDAPICNQTVTVTAQGTTISDFLPYSPIEDGFFHKGLSVRYWVRLQQDRAVFTLSRGLQQLEQLNNPRITRVFCLFREIPENIS